MSMQNDIARLQLQEKELVLPSFDRETAWRLGTTLRDLGVARHYSIVIEVRLFDEPLFYCALEGTSPSNPYWIRRKGKVVAMFHISSYAMGLKLKLQGTDLFTRHGLAAAEYAADGGSFPIRVENAGCIGSATVSGLAQRLDHELVVEALCVLTGKNYEALQLPAQDW